MNVSLHDPADRDELLRRGRAERDARQRDRYRSVLLAVDGRQAGEIAGRLARSRRFVQRWVYAYRDRGLAGLAAKKQTGKPPKLPRDQEQAFKERFTSPPRQDDGVCSLRGVDAVRILQDQFGVHYSLQGAYDLLHRLNLSCLCPRPRHRKNDERAMQEWVDDAPFLSGPSKTGGRGRPSRSGCRTRPASDSRGR